MASLFKNVVGAVMLVGATTLVTTMVTTQVVSQDAPTDLGNTPAAAQKAFERMAAWEQYSSPGAEHARMEGDEGLWLNDMTMWMYPGAPEMKSQGVSKMTSILGGRYLLEETTYVMDIPGHIQVGEGLGIFGFDSFKEKHFFIWLSNSSTMPMYGIGDRDENGDIVYYSKMPDPLDGSVVEYKSVTTAVSSGRREFTMYERQADGSWHKHMHFAGTRQD